EHTEIGYNYRLSNILAALGRAQLTRLDEMITRRREIRTTYAAAFADLPVRFLGRDTDRGDSEDNCWLTTLVIEDPSVNITVLVAARSDNGVETRHLWKTMYLQPVFDHEHFVGPGNAEQLFQHGLTLPTGSGLTDQDVSTASDLVLNHLPHGGLQ